MGNSDSSCYDFRKDEKNTSKEKNGKPKSAKKNTSYQDDSNLAACSDTSDLDFHLDKSHECKNQVVTPYKSPESRNASSSSDDIYTPVRQETAGNPNFLKINAFDPRSPTEGIDRTPIQLNQECVTFCDDPRSPSYGINRTPIVQQDNTSGNVVAKPAASNLNDPRSPTVEINRTPLNVAFSSENLRRTVLMTNTLKTSPLPKKIIYNLDKPSASSVVSQSEISATDESFFSANNFFTENMSSLPKTKEDAGMQASFGPVISPTVPTTLNNIVEQASNSTLVPSNKEKCHDDNMQAPFTEEQNRDDESPDDDYVLTESIEGKSDSTMLPLHAISPNSIVENSNDREIASNSNEMESEEMKSDEINLSDDNESADESHKVEARATKEKTINVASLHKTSGIPSRNYTDGKLPRSSNKLKSKTAVRNQNDTKQSPMVKEIPFKKLASQSTRSPLSMLGHSNSPEPKRFRPANESFSSGHAMTSRNRKKNSSGSRLPRYKAGRNSQN